MQDQAKIEKLVYEVIKDIKKSILQKQGAKEFRDTLLQESLDSLSMVNLIVSLEETIRQQFGISISLVGSDTGDSGLFKTTGSLIDHICLQLENKRS